jgi:phosphotransacetylase
LIDSPGFSSHAADTTVNLNPTSEELAEIATLTANAVQFFGVMDTSNGKTTTEQTT